jgi:hypothetical protein
MAPVINRRPAESRLGCLSGKICRAVSHDCRQTSTRQLFSKPPRRSRRRPVSARSAVVQLLVTSSSLLSREYLHPALSVPHTSSSRRHSTGSCCDSITSRRSAESCLYLGRSSYLWDYFPGPLAEEELLVPHPQAIELFMKTCSRIHRAIQFEGNERLYQRLYLVTFVSNAVLRRYGPGMKAKVAAAKSATRRERTPTPHNAFSTDDGGTSWSEGIIPSVQRMESALIRQTSLGALRADRQETRSLNLLIDPAPLAKEYIERWDAIQRIRRCVVEEAVEIKGASKFVERLRDLWTVWWMVAEDGEFLGWLTRAWRKLATRRVANLHRWVEQASSG